MGSSHNWTLQNRGSGVSLFYGYVIYLAFPKVFRFWHNLMYLIDDYFISSCHLAVSPSRVAVGCMTHRFSALNKRFAELKMDLSIWPALLSAIDLDADHSLADDVEVPQLPPVHVRSARLQPKIPPLIQQIHHNSSTSSTNSSTSQL